MKIVIIARIVIVYDNSNHNSIMIPARELQKVPARHCCGERMARGLYAGSGAFWRRRASEYVKIRENSVKKCEDLRLQLFNHSS